LRETGMNPNKITLDLVCDRRVAPVKFPMIRYINQAD
jgi:hypothetical protein